MTVVVLLVLAVIGVIYTLTKLIDDSGGCSDLGRFFLLVIPAWGGRKDCNGP